MIMLKAVGLRVRVAIAIASRSAHGDMLMLNNNHGSEAVRHSTVSGISIYCTSDNP